MIHAPHIVVIDDNPDDRALIIRHLRQAFPSLRVTEVADDEAFQRVLTTGTFDLVIADYSLRWTDGIAVLLTVKGRRPDCPIIMYTGTGNEEVAVEAMKAGLDDYVVKGVKHAPRLVAAVRTVLTRADATRRVLQIETRLHSLLNRLNVGVFRATLDGRFLEANPAFLRVVGLHTLEEVLQLDMRDLYCRPEDHREVVARLEADGSIQEHTVEWRSPTGRPFWVALTEGLDTTPEGEPVIEGLIEDITGRKEREQRREEFLNIISHELRSPLTVLKGSIGNLQNRSLGALTERQAEVVERADRTIARLERIVQQLLELARLESGRAAPRRVRVNVADLVAQLTRNHSQILARARGVDLGADVAPDLPVLQGDPDLLAEVVQNLLDNALRFAKSRVVVKVLSPERNNILMSVIDDGPGIPQGEETRLFDKFAQIELATGASGYKGTGLGLIICKGIVDQHAGRIWVESTPGSGAAFHVLLPSGPEGGGT